VEVKARTGAAVYPRAGLSAQDMVFHAERDLVDPRRH